MNPGRSLAVLLIAACCAGLIMPGASPAGVTLDVGDGSGALGSYNRPLQVSLDNPTDRVRAVDLKICDADNYLTTNTIIDCTTTTRSSGFNCIAYESSGCTRVILNPGPAGLIEKGGGAIATVNLNVATTAPAGACRALTVFTDSQTPKVYDEYNHTLSITTDPGQFCFSSCLSSAECNDGLYCTGTDTCSSGICYHAGNSCPGTECQHCNEAADNCYDSADTACTDDGQYCNGEEYCNGSGSCAPSNENPCPPGSTCNEAEDVCACDGTEDCNDGLFCTGFDYCVPGENICESEGDPCEGGPLHCDESRNACVCYYHNECDDGLYCTGQETCLSGTCQEGTNPCTAPFVCDEALDQCVNPDITVTVASGAGFIGQPGRNITVGLANPNDLVRAMSIDICDSKDFLTVTGCTKSGRVPSGYTCNYNALANGCDRVALYSIANPPPAPIAKGSGTLLTVVYTVKAPPAYVDTGCISLDPTNIAASDQDSNALTALGKSGQFCLYCAENADCENNPCTDDTCNQGTFQCVHVNNSNTCNDGLFCTTNDRCSGGLCTGTGDACGPYQRCMEAVDQCIDCPGDYDCDSFLDGSDNCLQVPNGSIGTCTRVTGGVVEGYKGQECAIDSDCPLGQTCSNDQEDFNSNGVGDACECYADGNHDGKVNTTDLGTMKTEFFRTNCATVPCLSDCNADTKVNTSDLGIMKLEFFRTGCPTP